MRIVAPISELEELEPLAAAGAGELYCGLAPSAWRRRFGGGVWSSRRGPLGGNILEFHGLVLLVREAHRLGLPVSLALNAPYHTPAMLEDLLPLARRAVEEAGADALIVGDPALAAALRETQPDLPITASSIGAARNGEAVRFWRDLGARRIIIPRHITPPEMARLREAAPELEYEAFILNDGCAFDESCCATHHGGPGEPAFCFGDRERRAVASSPEGFAEGDGGLWEDTLQGYREWLSGLRGRTAGLGPRGLPDGACGLCALPDLRAAGITLVKVAGRQGSMVRKIRSVQLVRAVLDRLSSGAGAEEVRRFATSLRGDPAACASGLPCCYRTAPAAGEEGHG